jgi:CHAD domain-containing protein/CYTH domain-containing protein
MLRDAARRGARHVALDLLATVREDRERLGADDDPEALHDFRVALRRLRSWLRAFREMFQDTLAAKDERRLKTLARATSTTRDLEVHIAWVETARRSLRGRSRSGARWLRDRLAADKAAGDVELQATLEREFDRVAKRLDRAFKRFEARVVEPEPRFAVVYAELVGAHAKALAVALESVSSAGDRVEAHTARIAAKRLRYLLEPLESMIPAAHDGAQALRGLQDALGELHDAQLFGSELASMMADLLARRRTTSVDPVAGLEVLLRRLRRTERRAFERFTTTWTPDIVTSLMSHVGSVEATLRAIGKEAREVERKYLLREMPSDMPPAIAADIHQGYLPGERLVERVRSAETSDGIRYYRTMKLGVGLERVEIEEATDATLFKALWSHTKGRRIHKRRHRVEENGVIWEIDEFLDRDLVLAEIELDDRGTMPPIPDWLSAVMEREVTGDEEFSNRALAR